MLQHGKSQTVSAALLFRQGLIEDSHLKDHFAHGLRAVQLHFDAVGVFGEHHQKIPGREGQFIMALAPVGVEIIGLRPFKLLEGIRRATTVKALPLTREVKIGRAHV